jgi:hypothetical protein
MEAKDKPASKGNGKAPLPVVEKRKYVLEDQVRNRWCVTLPKDATKEHLALASTYAAAPEGVQRFDVLTVVAADDSFMGEILVLEPAKGGCAVLVLRVFDLPPRREVGARGLHPDFRIYQGTSEQGLVVERKNPDGSKHVLGMGRDNPSWGGDYGKAEEWLRGHAAYAANQK